MPLLFEKLFALYAVYALLVFKAQSFFKAFPEMVTLQVLSFTLFLHSGLLKNSVMNKTVIQSLSGENVTLILGFYNVRTVGMHDVCKKFSNLAKSPILRMVAFLMTIILQLS